MAAMLALRMAPGVACDQQTTRRPALLSVRPALPRDTRCKAGDNHLRPFTAAAVPQPDVAWNAYDAEHVASNSAETARWSLESADFWISDVDEPEVPTPTQQHEEHAAYMHIWSSASFVIDAETSRNSLDSMDVYME